MHRRLLTLIAAASLLSMPVLAQGNGKAYGKANTNVHTTAVMNGTVVRTHTVSNPSQTFTQTHVHKMKVKKHATKHVKKVKVVTRHTHVERQD